MKYTRYERDSQCLYHWLLFVPGISGLGIFLCPFAVLPVSQWRVFDLHAEDTGFARVRCGSGWCRTLSAVPGRHRVLNANLNGLCGRCTLVFAVSVCQQETRMMSLGGDAI